MTGSKIANTCGSAADRGEYRQAARPVTQGLTAIMLETRATPICGISLAMLLPAGWKSKKGRD